ncbi:TatD family hydrolase [Defluviicoccus vanus]|uniref:TatD family hydrolase n=1 Tax=Defluviicoccus vanus TaxID=111831 RepID=A0A7H1MXP2_9PROT|nr:TatD family hydrolase [Defluviicoccus vanus]QNT68228.1 TatD family hydrolase [Defluviicoccus vanus]
MWVDSHCHLDFPDFASELDAVVERATAAGVTTLLTISTHLSRFASVLAVAERFPNVYCTVGIHPHEVASEGVAPVERLIELAQHPKVVGFGETGLDFFYDHSPRALQEEGFRAHIAAARATGLPVVIHTRDADATTLRVLDEEMAKGRFTGLLHCFSSGAELAEQAVVHGLHISFSGILTFKKASHLVDIARTLPLDRLLVETDAPFLAPVPHRGKRNEPAFTRMTGRKLAEARNMDEAAMATITSDNFFRLFHKAR